MTHPQTPTDKDQLWLDVLAGRAEPSDADTRQAAQLRTYLERRAEEELNTQPDPARERRMLDYLQAHGALAAPRSAAPAPGLLQRLAHWLFPPGAANGFRYAMAAALLCALAIPLVLLVQRGTEDPLAYKDFTTPGEVLTIRAADPQLEARRLAAILAGHGVNASLSASGAQVLLKAEVPAAARDAIRKAMLDEGIPIAADGPILLRIEPLK
ncbi:MAG: hypothetical protein JNJ60_12640 [Rhodocyclaceae bacterium]|nr:hypothetical protein [Rhodocyclaceae bacterium]